MKLPNHILGNFIVDQSAIDFLRQILSSFGILVLNLGISGEAAVCHLSTI